MHPEQKYRLTRREFLKLVLHLARYGFFIGTAGAVYARWVEPFWVETTEVELSLPRLPRTFTGLRMLQLSDIHLDRWMDENQLSYIVSRAVRARPDVVVITGDFVNGDHWLPVARSEKIAELVSALSPLAQACPTFAVLGNHDYWADASAVRQALAEAGIIELSNAVYSLESGAEHLYICGLDDVWEKHNRLADILDVLPPDCAAILLVHEPDFATISASTGRFDLQLSGHTHGGQVVLPFIGAPVRPTLGMRYPVSGLCKVKDMYLYTNRGVGMGEVWVRFNCRPEITVFTLHPAG